MNILLLGSPYFRRDFEACGHQVKTCTIYNRGDITVKHRPVPIQSIMSSLPHRWNPDLVLLGDESTHPMYLGLEFLDIPLAWYAVDSHLHLPWHKAYASAFDFIFVAQKGYIDSYRRDRTRQIVQWLPLFCDPAVDRCLDLPKYYDLSFVGTLHEALNPARVRLIREIQCRFPIHVTTGDYVSVFNQSKLVLNQCVANDVNFRTFEAMACGSFLLMEKVGNGLDELFQDRVHLALYDKGNADQIIALTYYYLEHADEREEIAAQGRKAVLSAHTSAHRAETILSVLQACDVNALLKRRKSRLHEIQALLAVTYDYAANAHERWPFAASRDIPTYTALAAAIRKELQAAKKTCDVSIIIPVFNSVEPTLQCLTRLAQVTHDVTYEVIVVDNGSTDGAALFLATLSGNVEVIRNEENVCVAKACNQGARAAHGRYLVFLNSDTVPQEGFLEALVREVEADPEVAMVGSKLLDAEGSIWHAGIAFARGDALPHHVYRGFPANAPVVNRRRELQAVSAACVLVRRELFEAVEGFDEGYRNGLEDVDLCLKIRERGGKVIYQPNSVLYHLAAQASGRKDDDVDNVQRLLERWGGRWLEDEDAVYVPDGYAVQAHHNGEQVSDCPEPLTDPQEKEQWQQVAEVQRLAQASDMAAVQALLAQAERWPANTSVLRWGARVCCRAGVRGYARAFWRRLLALEEAPEARLTLARLALETGACEEAEEHLGALLSYAPMNSEGWLLKGRVALQRQEYAQASAAFEMALHNGGDPREARLGLGITAMSEGQAAVAWERFAAVLAEEPDHTEAIHWLLRAGTALRRWEALAGHLSDYLRLNPGDLTVRFALAGVHVRLANWEGAQQEYETLRLLQPTFEGLHELAQTLEREMP